MSPAVRSLSPIPGLLAALQLAARLKDELRHLWTAAGRRESVAEHSYQMALMTLLLHPHLEHPVDLGRTLELVLVHDLVEAEAGDVVAFDTGPAKDGKAAREHAAAEHLRALISAPGGERVYAAWHEFEAGATGGGTPEARFARALDHLEVQLQHNWAPLSTWEPVEVGLTYTKTGRGSEHHAFLRAFAAAVVAQGETKLAAGGVDVAAARGVNGA